MLNLELLGRFSYIKLKGGHSLPLKILTDVSMLMTDAK